MTEQGLSARAHDKVLRIARTIARLCNKERVAAATALLTPPVEMCPTGRAPLRLDVSRFEPAAGGA
ncbi:MAG: hypothetical protein JSV19_03315 [Phycisphaerales bacterium]|nr:MAG: hypothetical protein JSV19_03315 [Phycisphaerales bacterium]